MTDNTLEDKTWMWESIKSSRKARILKWVGTIASIGVVLFSATYFGERIREKNRLYPEMILKTDTLINKDNKASHEEWAKVYESFGLTYDMASSKPKRDLYLEQMREYLGKE